MKTKYPTFVTSSRIGVLVLFSLFLVGCPGLENLEINTTELLQSMQKMEKTIGNMQEDTHSLASSTERIATSVEKLETRVDEKLKTIEDQFVELVGHIESVSASLKDFQQLIHMIEYLESISNSMDEVASKTDQMERFMDRIYELLDQFFPEGHIENEEPGKLDYQWFDPSDLEEETEKENQEMLP